MKLRLSLNILLCLIINSSVISAQKITTIAGGGAGPLGDGGPATMANIGLVAGLAIDNSGNIYLCGSLNRVRKVDISTGIITTIAGTGVAGYNGDGILAMSAQLNEPAWLTLDSAGNIYIADCGNYRIRKIDAQTGLISTYAGNGTPGFIGDSGLAINAELNNFQDIAMDGFENLYINDLGNNRIRKIDSDGIITTIAGTGLPTNTGDGGLAVAASIYGNLGLCTDRHQNVYTTDDSGSVRKININTDIISRVAGLGNGVSSPYLGDGLLATMSHIGDFGVAVDDTGNLYIADYANARIEKVDTFGIIRTVAGNGIQGYNGDGGLADTSEVNHPENVIADHCGNIYVSDFSNRRIRKVTFDTACHLESLNLYQETAKASAINVYPNPATTELTITSPIEIREVTISNMLGQKVITQHQSSSGNKEIKINIAGLPLGMYFVTVTDSEGQKTVRKIVKQ